MDRKRALIVDDSKSARIVLSRMLEKYDIAVDTAESAEQSIEYLQNNRPDAIFMDHLMPGMDGLQALQAIKGNAETATIPIMMYTSQEGELYLGQARALGASGVLPKQMRPVDVSKVLHDLQLVPTPAEAEPAPAAAPLNGVPSIPKPVTAGGVDWGRRVEVTVKEQSADLRRFIVASLDSFAARVVGDVREAMPPVKSAGEPAPILAPVASAKLPQWPWLLASIAACVLAAVFGVLWASSRDALVKAQMQVASLTAANAELTRARQDLGDTVKDLTSAVAAGAAGSASATSLAGGGVPSLLRTDAVPYGEMPLDRARLETLRELLGKLEAQGFHGVLKITSVAGLYCLSGNASDGYTLANATLPFAKCDLVGNPVDESSVGQPHQSLAFANLVQNIRQRSAGAITVVIASANEARPLTPYPARSDSLTAGEWNKAASANNRVEFLAEPGATAP
jgi:CheY-like chemotaxis protein